MTEPDAWDVADRKAGLPPRTYDAIAEAVRADERAAIALRIHAWIIATGQPTNGPYVRGALDAMDAVLEGR